MEREPTIPGSWTGYTISGTRRCQSCGNVVNIMKMCDDGKLCYACEGVEWIRQVGQRIALENESDCEI